VDGPELAVMNRILKQSIEAQLRNPAYEYAVRVSRVNYGDCYYFKAFTLDVSQLIMLKVLLCVKKSSDSNI
jgi:hypothetical protein